MSINIKRDDLYKVFLAWESGTDGGTTYTDEEWAAMTAEQRAESYTEYLLRKLQALNPTEEDSRVHAG